MMLEWERAFALHCTVLKVVVTDEDLHDAPLPIILLLRGAKTPAELLHALGDLADWCSLKGDAKAIFDDLQAEFARRFDQAAQVAVDMECGPAPKALLAPPKLLGP